MGNGSAKVIETWFAECSDGTEFEFGSRTATYSVIGPPSSASRIVFATKASPVALAIEKCADLAEFGMIAHYGLPSDADIQWIRRVVGKRELLFLGDMDPVDLMIFAWLRVQLASNHLVYLGISDSYLAERQVSLPESFIMPLAFSEQKSLPVLAKAFPDFREIVGCKCAELLERGCKIEIDAIVSAMQFPESILIPRRF